MSYDPFFSSRINEIERKANDAAPHYELYALARRVDSLEHSMRETRAEIDGLRSQLETAQNALIRLQECEIDRLQS